MPSSIFSGRRNKLLTRDAILKKNGGIIDYDGDFDAILNGHFEKNIKGWAVYADAASPVPVDGTGGAPTITLSRSTVSPLGGIASGLITKDAANRQGEGISYDFSIEQRYKKTTNLLVLDYEASGNYTGESGAEYLSAWLYDTTNNKLYPFRQVNLPGSTGTFIIPGNYTDSGTYRIIFHISGNGTSAWTYKFKVRLQSFKGSLGNSMGQFKATTMTPGNFGSVTNPVYMMQERAGFVKFFGYFVTGTTAASPGYVQLPAGMNIDVSSPSWNVNQQHSLGNWWGLRQGGPSAFTQSGSTFGVVTYIASAPDRVYFGYQSNNKGIEVNNALDMLAAGDGFSFEFEVPIKELSGQAQVVNSVVEYAYNTDTSNADDNSSFGYGPEGVTFGSYATTVRLKRIRFKSPILQTDKVFLQILDDATGNWQDHQSTSEVEGGSRDATSNFGLWTVSVPGSLTDVDVVFGAGGRNRKPDAWASIAGTFKWRLVKASNPLGVEVQAPQALSSKSSTFPLSTAGYANNEYAQMTGNNLVLTSGLWDIEFLVQTIPSGAAVVAGVRAALYEANGANDGTPPAALTNIEVGDNDEVVDNPDNTSAVDTQYFVKSNPVRVRVAGTKTVYCVPRVPFVSAGAAGVITYMFARKVV